MITNRKCQHIFAQTAWCNVKWFSGDGCKSIKCVVTHAWLQFPLTTQVPICFTTRHVGCVAGSFIPLSAFYVMVSISASPPCKVAAVQITAHCLQLLTEHFFHGPIITLIIAPWFLHMQRLYYTCCEKSAAPLSRTDCAMASHLNSS